MTDVADAEVDCLACGVRFIDDSTAYWCERCHDGPLCRYCLILRHMPTHDRSSPMTGVKRALRWLGFRRSQRRRFARAYGRR